MLIEEIKKIKTKNNIDFKYIELVLELEDVTDEEASDLLTNNKEMFLKILWDDYHATNTLDSLLNDKEYLEKNLNLFSETFKIDNEKIEFDDDVDRNF